MRWVGHSLFKQTQRNRPRHTDTSIRPQPQRYARRSIVASAPPILYPIVHWHVPTARPAGDTTGAAMNPDTPPCPTCNTASSVRLIPRPVNFLRHLVNGILFLNLARSHGIPMLRLKVRWQCNLCNRVFTAAESKTQHTICERCGYNLTGNTSGRCPECGRSIPDRVKALITSHASSSTEHSGDSIQPDVSTTTVPTNNSSGTDELE